MGQKLLSSAYLSATLLVGIIFGAPTTFAQAPSPVKEEAAIDLEKVKPPPRDIKDVLKVLQQSKPNAAEIDKAKAIVATPVPITEDKEVLNTFYYKRAKAYQDLGKIQHAIADTLLTVEKYPANDLRMRLEDIMQLGAYEGFGGKNTNTIKTFERAKAFQLSNLPNSIGFQISINRQLTGAYASAGNFEAAKNALDNAEAALFNLRRSRGYMTYGPAWESGYESARGIYFSSQGKWI